MLVITSRTKGCLSLAGPGLLRIPCLPSSSLCSMDFVSKAQLLPPAPFPNDDPASVKGNASTEQKRLSANVLAWHIANFPGSRVFGNREFKDMKLTEVYIWKMNAGETVGLLEDVTSREAARGMSLRGQTVCELTVSEGTPFSIRRLHQKRGAHLIRLFDRDVKCTSHICWWLLGPPSRYVCCMSRYSGGA